jgi:hypothetical protein
VAAAAATWTAASHLFSEQQQPQQVEPGSGITAMLQVIHCKHCQRHPTVLMTDAGTNLLLDVQLAHPSTAAAAAETLTLPLQWSSAPQLLPGYPGAVAASNVRVVQKWDVWSDVRNVLLLAQAGASCQVGRLTAHR